MKFKNTVMLLGVVGKKGSGTLDNGQAWQTDRVELHVLSDFDSSKTNSVGKTVVVYQIQDFNENYQNAKSCVGQNIVIDFEMVASEKLGQAPKMMARSFVPEKIVKVS